MSVSFLNVIVGNMYSRPELADLWGYKGYQALARGVVTPSGTPYIILFVTEEKQGFQEQYHDKLVGNILEWEGPTDHFAEDRMINSNITGDQIHIFHRVIHHTNFTYLGRARVQQIDRYSHKPSKFNLSI
jgi:hypothetical protein